jgi:uncharacterized delta-60 repeat protein
MPTIRIVAEFLQQQLNNTSFGYEIYNNGDLVSKVDKTFKSEIIESVGNIVSLDNTNNYNFVGDFTVGFNGAVYSITKQTTGKYIVSGSFTEYNGQPALGICRLNEDFSLDTDFNSLPITTIPFGFAVRHKLLSDDTIIIYGVYQNSGGSPYIPSNLAKLNDDGSIDTTFKGVGFTNRVYDIAIDGADKIYVVGAFLLYTYFNGSTNVTVNSRFIARITSDGTYDSAFVVGTGFSVVQFIIAYNFGSDSVVVGSPGTYKGDNINGLMEINNVGTKTSKYSTLGTGGGGNIVTAMYFNTGGKLTLSGWFNSYAGVSCTNLIRINNDGSRDTTLNTLIGLNAPAVTITGDGTFTYLGGNFTVYGGTSIDKFVKINSVGNVPPYSQYDFIGAGVQTIFLDNVDKVLVGGFISTYANIFVPNNETIIPIGSDTADTQDITLQNLIDFNSATGLTYTSVNNNILVEYTYDEGDVISIINAFDIINYLELVVDNEFLTPTVTITNSPQVFTPVYNPVVFKFNSPYITKPGFRYLFNVFNSKDDLLIARFKLSPQIDGSGYIDISKILSNLTTVDLPPFVNDFNIDTDITTYDADKSYVDYYIEIGVEFNQSWGFDNIYSDNGNVTLSNSVFLGHSYVAGDQIIVSSSLTPNAINGLHQVIEVIDDYNIVIDALFVEGTPETTFGVTNFADNSKLSFNNLASVTNLIAFNGARPWNDFINWKGLDYTMSSVELPAKFLTDIPATGFNITPTQDIYLNIHFDITESIYPIIVAAETNNNITSFIDELTLSEIDGSIQQVAVGFNQISEIFADCAEPENCVEYYDVYLIIDGDPELRVSEKIRFNIDKRCKIEEYEILFMDRMGSLASYAFQLRASERGTIKRDMIKQHVDYNLLNDSYLNSYDITGRGSLITNVDVVKTLELNTNWMTDEMSVYFEQLLTSPYTWIKVDGKYYACTINNNDFEVTRQKNKNLIRKTVTITFANNNIINI